MGQELTRLPCPRCGTAGEADPGRSRWQCTSCGSGYFLRRCSACTRVSYVDGLQGIRMRWPCTWCGHFNSGFSQNQDPAAASAAELAAELAGAGPRATAAGDGPGGQELPGADADSPPGPLPGPALPPYYPAYYPPGPAHQAPGLRPPSPGSADPGGGKAAGYADPARPRQSRAWRVGLPTAVIVACAAAVTALLTAGHPGAAAMPAARPLAQAATTRPVLFTVSQVASVDFQGAAGRLVIAGAGSRQVTLTGKLTGNGGAPSVQARLDHATGALTVSIRCPAAAQCTQDLRLAVPGDAGITVRQAGGQVRVTGLAGPLCITAANTAVSASGLRSPRLTAVIANGRLSAAFSTPPRQVGISLVAAQATIRLPASAAYRVIRDVLSGYVRAAVPQASGAARTVTARVRSGELELLPS